MKQCLDVLVPIITRIVNKSFSTATVPTSFKLAAIIPILKKANLIPDILKNFRPISNLSFVSKILEKVASIQLLSHKDHFSLREKFQSAYREWHSTETALLRIHHDLLLALDNKQCVFMAMLDLSAAFDTVSHEKLLSRLSTSLGITDLALEWLKSYLTGRRQFVSIKGYKSKEHLKTCDVPQGSILGPNLYEDYSANPIGSIFRKHNISYHIYADDTQAYICFNENNKERVLNQLEKCLDEVRMWMAANWLKLNDDKTEFIVFGSKKSLNNCKISSIKIGESGVERVSSVKSIGAHLDSNLTMDKHVAATCKSAWFHLHQINKIKNYLSCDQLKSVILAYVISRIDQNNSLLIGLPKATVFKLQMIQNACAKIIFRAKKFDHVTPLLKELHWLPVEQRITFKILLLVYKCLHGKAPAYLRELLEEYVPSRSLRSASKGLLRIPERHYTSTKRRDFAHRGPVEWNKLPKVIRDSDSINIFKRRLKTYLFRIVFSN